MNHKINGFAKAFLSLPFNSGHIVLIFALLAFFTFSQCKSLMHPYQKINPIASFEELDYPFEVKKVKLPDGPEIAYVDQGQGPQTIIFIHGLGSYLPAWKKNVEALSKDYRCIAIDLPGYGKSSKEAHSGQMTYYASVVNEFANQLGLDKVILAGHSMGGQIAMVTSLYYPNRVDKLILAAPAGFESFTDGQKEWFRKAMTVRGVANTSVEDIVTNLAYNFYKMPKDAEFMITDRIIMRDAQGFDDYCYAVVQSVKGMVDQPMSKHLSKITQPTLILFGQYDNLIPNRFLNPGKTSDIAEIGAKNIPNNKLVMIPDAGHFLQFEKADIFNQEVKKFLEETK